MDDALTTISLPGALVGQADRLAHRLNLPPERVFELALQALSQRLAGPVQLDEAPRGAGERPINQGDLFWIRPRGAEAGLGHYPHPYVVIQDDILNRSRITTVVVCALTTNLRQANAPGNVLLDAGEADLPRRSIVDVAKVSTVQASQLGEYIGTLDQRRVRQILAGMRFLQLSFFDR